MSATVAPLTRSHAQKLAALERANDIRVKRSRMKTALKEQGYELAAELLADPPTWLVTMRVENFLLSLPKFGPSKARRIMREHLVGQAKTVGGLSPRQRDVLVCELELRAGRPVPLLSDEDTRRRALAKTASARDRKDKQ